MHPSSQPAPPVPPPPRPAFSFARMLVLAQRRFRARQGRP
jgi:hypothetical protein